MLSLNQGQHKNFIKFVMQLKKYCHFCKTLELIKIFFFDEPETILKSKKQSYRALLDSSKMMEEKQAGQFPKSKGPKILQERDHFAKEWAAVLHCLGTHFTKTLSNADKDSLNSKHKD